VTVRASELAKLAAVLAKEASDLADLHGRGKRAPDATRRAALRAAAASAALEAVAERDEEPGVLIERATRALGVAARALALARRAAPAATRRGSGRRLAPATHHQRCLACGKLSLADTGRGATDFRHKHRKTCPDAAFEHVRP
jgi:hypothetical protein